MIYNEINGIEATPQGAQKRFLLNRKSDDIRSNYNGYGYKDTTRCYTLSDSELAEYHSLLPTKKREKFEICEEDRIATWARRLVKLTDISIEEATKIGQQKIKYHEDKIYDMKDRDIECPSKQRDRLIQKMERENPLRRIIDADHAQAILSAYNRHKKTDYEYQLEQAHEMEQFGELQKGSAREYARQNYK